MERIAALVFPPADQTEDRAEPGSEDAEVAGAEGGAVGGGGGASAPPRE